MNLKSPFVLVVIGAALGYFLVSTLIGSVPLLGAYYKKAQNYGAA